MKKILYSLLAVASLFVVESAMAQSRTSYHMEGSIFRNELNPALAPTRGYLALPGMSGVGLSMGSNWLSVDNLIYERDGGLVTGLHSSVSADEFLGRIPDITNMYMRESLNVLGLGFYTGKSFWTIGVEQRMSLDFNLSKDIFRAAKTLGNGVYDLSDTSLHGTAYLDAYLGTSIHFCKWLSIGVKAKFLVGVANINASFSQLALNVSESGAVGELKGDWYGNAVAFDNAKALGAVQPTITDFLNLDPMQMLDRADSYGFAFDVGTEIRLWKNHIKISAALTDFGLIRWSPATYISGQVTGGVGYNGFNFESGEIDATGTINTDKLFMNDAKGYETRLNMGFNAGFELNFLRNHIALGVMSHTEFVGSESITEITASLNLRPAHWLSATVSRTFQNNNCPGVFGAALNFHPGVLNIFVSADFIDPNFVVGPQIEALGGRNLLLSRYAQGINLYAGVGINFARPKYMREEARELKAQRKAKRRGL